MKEQEIGEGRKGIQDTIYLCNFRVSVDGDWLCLRQLDDVEVPLDVPFRSTLPSPIDFLPYGDSQFPNFSPLQPLVIPDRDPTAVERSNLLNITKLVVKELIEWSIRHGRSLDADHPPLQHFFIVLEHALRHGLKPKKGLLGPKKELWDVIQTVERCTSEAQDITTSIRDLPTVSTHLGRARAWLRLALIQKKLADYFKILVDNRDDGLKDYYEPIALMMCEEATVLAGLLVGLNVIDCNFCLKEEDLDSQQGVIDFSLYLRSSRSSDSVNDDVEPTNNIDSVLDQKNYIEELNRHLNATVTNLQSRVETLTTTNALMKEDLAISKKGLQTLQEENKTLKKKLEESPSEEIIQEKDESSVEPKQKEEKQLITNLEKDLQIEKNKNSETEIAMKLLEKDVHEKQDTIISLRKQLDEIKIINLEMYRKLQDCEKALKYKTDLMSKQEAKATLLAETINKLDEKLESRKVEVVSGQETMRSLGSQIADQELKVSTLEGDLRIEREWRQSLQDALVKDKERISELNMEVQRLNLLSNELETANKEIGNLQRTCRQNEETLNDMGKLLRASDIKLDQLRETAGSVAEAQWAKDKEVTNCRTCEKDFSLTTRKHHCRHCGFIYCSGCSDNVMPLPAFPKPVRVCDQCYTLLLQRCSKN